MLTNTINKELAYWQDQLQKAEYASQDYAYAKLQLDHYRALQKEQGFKQHLRNQVNTKGRKYA